MVEGLPLSGQIKEGLQACRDLRAMADDHVPFGGARADVDTKLRDLELLLNTNAYLSALLTLECSLNKFGLHFGSTSDSTVDRHETTQALYFQVSDLVHRRHIIITDLENAILAISLEANVTHKLHDSLAKEWLETMILFHY
jgi:hypothetical protein